jgi:hypothetical protein
MICSFCKQDVNGPSHNTIEMRQWADDHIDRCKGALNSFEGIVFG